MIALHALVKRYRDFTAVAGISLKIEPGELYVVLGPNGAGKTTAIKCMVGLLHPTAGSVLIGGHDVASEPKLAKSLIGYVPDRPFLYEKLTGAELIRYMGQLYGTDPARLARRAEEYLAMFDLRGWEGELIESYSYGMRQKIVLTAVLARDPPVLIIDEPMIGLDPHAAKTLREQLQTLARRGTSILMSTHSVGLAEQLASRIGIIDHGRLIAEGTMSELRERTGRHDEDLEQLFLSLTRHEGGGAEVPALPGVPGLAP